MSKEEARWTGWAIFASKEFNAVVRVALRVF